MRRTAISRTSTRAAARRSAGAALAEALQLLLAAAAAAQDLELRPAAIGESARDVRLQVVRADGRPFCAGPTCRPWVGVGFARLHRLRPKAAPSGRPVALTVRLSGVGAFGDPPPRAGDALLVVVYVGERPVAAPARLRIIGDGEGPGERPPPDGRLTNDARARQAPGRARGKRCAQDR